MSRPLSLAAALVACGLALGGVAAPAAAEQQLPNVAPAPSHAVSDREIHQYARATAHVVSIHHGAQQMMQRPGAERVAERIKVMETIEMAKAVVEEGLSIDRFNAISLGLRDDAELRQRVTAELERLGSEPALEADGGRNRGI